MAVQTFFLMSLFLLCSWSLLFIKAVEILPTSLGTSTPTLISAIPSNFSSNNSVTSLEDALSAFSSLDIQFDSTPLLMALEAFCFDMKDLRATTSKPENVGFCINSGTRLVHELAMLENTLLQADLDSALVSEIRSKTTTVVDSLRAMSASYENVKVLEGIVQSLGLGEFLGDIGRHEILDASVPVEDLTDFRMEGGRLSLRKRFGLSQPSEGEGDVDVGFLRGVNVPLGRYFSEDEPNLDSIFDMTKLEHGEGDFSDVNVSSNLLMDVGIAKGIDVAMNKSGQSFIEALRLGGDATSVVSLDTDLGTDLPLEDFVRGESVDVNTGVVSTVDEVVGKSGLRGSLGISKALKAGSDFDSSSMDGSKGINVDIDRAVDVGLLKLLNAGDRFGDKLGLEVAKDLNIGMAEDIGSDVTGKYLNLDGVNKNNLYMDAAKDFFENIKGDVESSVSSSGLWTSGSLASRLGLAL